MVFVAENFPMEVSEFSEGETCEGFNISISQ